MGNVTIYGVVAGMVLTAGCGAMRDQASTPNVPAGPVTASTTSTNVIPAGTQLVIRTDVPIETASAGGTFDAQVARDVQNENGRVLIPQGSAAKLVVMNTNTGGAVGTASLDLGIRSITMNGKTYEVNADTEERAGREGLGKNRRTAEMIGGGALLGTLIGAVAGGGSGAAIGAAVGAAGGATAQVLTRGKEVRVPAETLLTFRLDEPLRLRT